MEEEISPETVNATIVSATRAKEVVVGVNGDISKFPVNKSIPLAAHEREALENAGYQLVVEGDKSAADAEGSSSAVDQGPDNNRTEPHQAGEEDQTDAASTGIPGTRDETGAPVLVGGDEPDPLHGNAGKLAEAEEAKGIDPLDHDADGEKGGSLKKSPPALTGKTTAELEEIAKDEEIDLTEAKTNPERIAAIEKARAAKA